MHMSDPLFVWYDTDKNIIMFVLLLRGRFHVPYTQLLAVAAQNPAVPT